MPAPVDRGFRMLEGLQLPERYAMRRPIASGGMASVWCAHDRVLGRSVAIKLISQPFAGDEAAVRRFKREARAAARLSSHRHVVTIYDVGQAVDPGTPFGRPFIVMEYLAGGTVADAMRVGAVTRVEALRWLRQAAGALDYAHNRGVIHRDIKPVNLLLDCDRQLHVADFGIAQLATEDTFSSSGQLLGTAAYIAPEQVLGAPATEASDRYALAVAAFELLVGRRPFVSEHFAAQARAHLEQEPPAASELNPGLPRSLDPVLARGMAKRPEARWATAGELAAAIEEALGPARPGAATPGAETRRSRPTPPPSRAATRLSHAAPGRRPPRRSLALAALAAAALGVGVAAAASGTFDSPRGTPSAALDRDLGTPSTRHRAARSRPALRHHVTAASPTRTVQANPVAATTPPPTADALEAKGHELLVDGRYAAAIPVLRQAVSAASPSSLTYAYALFDLGRSLRLAGDPKAAASVLWRRLQIPNQTDVVRAELQLALRALGARAPHR